MLARIASSRFVSAVYGVSQPARSSVPLAPAAGTMRAQMRGAGSAPRASASRRADQKADGTDEITKGTNLIEDALGHHDRELALERQRQLHEVERIGGQIVTQRDVGDEFLDSDSKPLGDQTSNVWLHEFVHAPRPEPHRDRSRHARDSTTRPTSRSRCP